MNTCQNRFTRMFVMLLTLTMIVGAFSGCQKVDPEPIIDELELLIMETTEPSATEETEPETSLPAVTTEPTVSTEPTEESTEPAKADDKPHTHDFTTSVVAPTTSTKGYTLHTCKTCGYSYKDNYKNKLSGGNSGSSGDHTHSYTTSVTPATCTQKGYTTHTCKSCGYSYKTDEKAAMGHDWDDKGLDTDGWYAWQAATPDGKKPALSRRECKRCGAEEFRSEGLAHIPGELIETVAPTCTEEGYELHKCLGGTGSDSGWVCDYIHKVNIVPALGHDWSDWVVTTQPTQDKEGVETRTCSRCNATETRKVDKLPAGHTHKYEVMETVPATCTAAGKNTYTCSCGDSYEEEIFATGHEWGEWVRTQEPTQDAEGVETRTCSKCDAAETRPVDKLTNGHTHQYEITETVPASCTATGKNTFTCPCGDSYEEESPATGHAWGEWRIFIESNATTQGSDVRTCSKCNEEEYRLHDKPEPEIPEIDTSNSYIVTSEVMAVINKYREEQGAGPLSAGGGEDFAKVRAAELQIDFSHNRPYGPTSQDGEYDSRFRNECIADGYWDAQSVVDAWMASTKGHREAIMNPDHTVVTVARNGYRWVLLVG